MAGSTDQQPKWNTALSVGVSSRLLTSSPVQDGAAQAHLVLDVDESLRPPDGTDICLLRGQSVTRSGTLGRADPAGKHKQQHHAQQGRGSSTAGPRSVCGLQGPSIAEPLEGKPLTSFAVPHPLLSP